MAIPLTMKPKVETVPSASGAGILSNGHYQAPPKDKDGELWVRTTALVQASADDLYNIWRNVEAIPLWQEEIVHVVATGDKTSRWTMRSGDKTIEWTSEIMADEPGRRIAWRSISGDANNAGEVIFEQAVGGRGTVVVLLQEFRLGKLASIWETIVGRNPKQAVIENLRHFKALAESGEIPRVQGQPHGDRGLIGGIKESLYGEKIATPAGAELKAS